LAGAKVLVAEVPLYYETGAAVMADRVIVVAANRASQLARLQKSRGLNEAAAEEMFRLQLPIEAKAARADVVIWNDGSLEALEAQVSLLKAQTNDFRNDSNMSKKNQTETLPVQALPTVVEVQQENVVAEAPMAEVEVSDKPEESRTIPEELSIEEMQNMSLAQLQGLADAVGWRINASRNKHQIIFDIIAWTGSRGTRFIVDGVLDTQGEGSGCIRYPKYSFKPQPEDVFVPAFMIKKFGMLPGQRIQGLAKMPREREKFATLDRITAIEGVAFEDWKEPTPFEKLTPLFASQRIILETKKDPTIASRIVDIVAPLGKGQRGIIIASPRSGKTMLLKDIARSITMNHPEICLIVLLLDERPEEVTDFEETVNNCEIYSSTFDETPKRHAQVAELVLERAKRLVEGKKDVVVLLDSITRLARGYNTMAGGKGRTGSGGLDHKAREKSRRFFGAARNVEEGGSLTIIGTALVETESKMDDIIFEEFKGTGNMEVCLDREMAERRIFPAIHVTKSGTRRDDLLYHPDEFKRISVIRRQLASVPAMEAIETLIKNMQRLKTNAELVMLGLK
jgi:transcription termination factor Rho